MLAHDDTGSGTPIVFLHGFPLDRRMWRQQVEDAVHAGLRAIAVDLPGFGESPAPLHSIDAYADSVASFLVEKKIDKAIVCGLSMGGYIALALQRRHARHLLGLVLADTKAEPDGPEQKKARDTNIALARREGSAAVFDAMTAKVLASSEHVTALRAIADAQPVDSIVAALEAMRDRPDATSDLAHITVTTRIIVGAEDQVTPVSLAEAMATAVPNATLHVIEGAGHFSNIERPEAFSKAALHAWK